jgi:hypothetical protein
MVVQSVQIVVFQRFGCLFTYEDKPVQVQNVQTQDGSGLHRRQTLHLEKVEKGIYAKPKKGCSKRELKRYMVLRRYIWNGGQQEGRPFGSTNHSQRFVRVRNDMV